MAGTTNLLNPTILPLDNHLLPPPGDRPVLSIPPTTGNAVVNTDLPRNSTTTTGQDEKPQALRTPEDLPRNSTNSTTTADPDEKRQALHTEEKHNALLNMVTSEEATRENKEAEDPILVGMFCGTSGEFSDDVFGKLSLEIERKPNIGVHGYSGCDKFEQDPTSYLEKKLLGKGIFARGIYHPSNDFYEKTKKFIEEQKQAGNNKKTKIVLFGHSRGCLSIFQLIDQINKDPELRDQVEFFLDLRDPVPGALKISTTTGWGDGEITSRLQDLTHCANVKEVNITLHTEEPNLIRKLPNLPIRAAFTPCIPQFHHNTRLKVEVVPGAHDVQQHEYDDDYITNEDAKSAWASELGSAKSRQLLLEQGVPLRDHKISKQHTIESVKEVQRNCYIELVKLEKKQEEKTPTPIGKQIQPIRDIHLTRTQVLKTTHTYLNRKKRVHTGIAENHLNPRHAALAEAKNARPLYYFSSNDRFDLQYSHILHAKIDSILNDDIKLKFLSQSIKDREDAKASPLEEARNALNFTHTLTFKENQAWIKKVLQVDIKTEHDVRYVRAQLQIAIRNKFNAKTKPAIPITEKDDFTLALRKYKTSLELRQANGLEYNSSRLFGRIGGGISATQKIDAVNNMLLALDNSAQEFTRQDIEAFKDSRLKAMLSQYQHLAPKNFKKCKAETNKTIQVQVQVEFKGISLSR